MWMSPSAVLALGLTESGYPTKKIILWRKYLIMLPKPDSYSTETKNDLQIPADYKMTTGIKKLDFPFYKAEGNTDNGRITIKGGSN